MRLEGRPELIEDITNKYPKGIKELKESKKVDYIEYSEDLELASRLAQDWIEIEPATNLSELVQYANSGRFDLTDDYIKDLNHFSDKKSHYYKFLGSIISSKFNYIDRLIEYQSIDWDAKPQKREDLIKELNNQQESDLEEIVTNNKYGEPAHSLKMGGINIAAGIVTTSATSIALHYSDSLDKTPYVFGLMMGPALVGIGLGYLVNAYLENKSK